MPPTTPPTPTPEPTLPEITEIDESLERQVAAANALANMVVAEYVAVLEVAAAAAMPPEPHEFTLAVDLDSLHAQICYLHDLRTAEQSTLLEGVYQLLVGIRDQAFFRYGLQASADAAVELLDIMATQTGLTTQQLHETMGRLVIDRNDVHTRHVLIQQLVSLLGADGARRAILGQTEPNATAQATGESPAVPAGPEPIRGAGAE